MLLSFSIRNYKNFKEKQTLNFYNEKNKKINYPSCIPIYGENGSGKSNLLKALFLLKQIIIRPLATTTPTSNIANDIFLTSFKLDSEFINKPSEFEIEFVNNGSKYKYFIEFDNNIIYFEQLNKFNDKTKQYNYIYKRHENKVKFNEKSTLDLIDNTKKIMSEKNKIKLDNYTNIPYLNLLWSERIDFACNIYMFFSAKLFVFPTLLNNGETNGFTTINKIKNNDKETIINFLNSVNINIEDISIKEKEVNTKDVDFATNQINDNKIIVNDVILYRKNNENKLIDFDFQKEESDGTKKLFNLVGDLISVLSNGSTIVFDELDKSLHIDLILFILELFNNKDKNTKNAQLIFTTHNTSLLDNKYNLFPLNKVYIINKKYSGESEVYSIEDVGGINGKSKENLYLNGMFGGIPSTTDFYI